MDEGGGRFHTSLENHPVQQYFQDEKSEDIPCLVVHNYHEWATRDDETKYFEPGGRQKKFKRAPPIRF